MPWEAFLQPLKRMFDACNWISPPLSVCEMWATKAVMKYRDPSYAAWVEDSVVASGDYEHDVCKKARDWPFLQHMLDGEHAQVNAVRSLNAVQRGKDDLRVGDTVLIEQLEETPKVARIAHMVQLVCVSTPHAEAEARQYGSRIRMWCTDGHEAALNDDGIASVDIHASGCCMIVRLELAQITVVVSSVSSDRLKRVYQ
jgi:hypothetical protein